MKLEHEEFLLPSPPPRGLKAKVDELGRHCARFLFESESPARVRLFRRVFATILLVAYLTRLPDIEFFYSENGVLPLAFRSDFGMGVFPSLFAVFTSPGFLWAAYGTLMLSLCCMILGIFPRLASAVAYVIHVSFVHRNMGSVYGMDLVSIFYLAYLSFARGGRRQPEGGSRGGSGRGVFPSWVEGFQADLSSAAFRLAQIQLCVVYLYSGIGKLKGGLWWSGEALWTVLANVQLVFFDFAALAQFPVLIAFMTYAVLAWEIYFPVLIWVRGLRGPVLLFGVLMHLGIAVAMNLVFFSSVMLATYLLFLTETQALRVEAWFGGVLRRGLGRPSSREPAGLPSAL